MRTVRPSASVRLSPSMTARTMALSPGSRPGGKLGPAPSAGATATRSRSPAIARHIMPQLLPRLPRERERFSSPTRRKGRWVQSYRRLDAARGEASGGVVEEIGGTLGAPLDRLAELDQRAVLELADALLGDA